MPFPEFMHGVHDTDGVGLMDGFPGWVVITEAIGHDHNDYSGRDYSEWQARGLGVMVRLNNAHNGKDGTIPAPEHYTAFAQRCGNYVERSKGIDVVIVGNEPNHKNEWPHGQPIDALDYARCYGWARTAIRAARPGLPVLVGAMAPWNNSSGDWLTYLARVTNNLWGGADGFALHAYTHGPDPALIYSEEVKHGWKWHFHTYREQLFKIKAIVKGASANLLFAITETNQGDGPWLNVDSGWVQNAYDDVVDWNVNNPDLLVRGLVLYRSNVDDQWSFADKEGVQRDFHMAVERQHKAPPYSPPASTPPTKPQEQEVQHLPSIKVSPAPPPALAREIDPRAARRGTAIQTPMVQPGQPFWHAKRLYTPNEAESDLLGPDRHILTNTLINGVRQVGVPLLVTWGNAGPDERATLHTKDNPGYAFSGDFGLTPGDFTLEVADGRPSERVVNIKMGEFDDQGRWNPGAHTSTLVDWELRAMPEPAQNPAPTGTRAYVVEPLGANLRGAPVDGMVLVAVPYGKAVQMLDIDMLASSGRQSTNADQPQWVRVRYDDDNTSTVGYMYAPLLGPNPPAPAPKPRNGIALFHPLGAGPKPISQYFLENPDFYKQFVYDGVPLIGHNGLDFGVVSGSNVYAVDDGKVLKAAHDPAGWGNYLDIGHVWGLSLYAHLRHFLVKEGDFVSKGDLIAYSGNTGISTGPHLHFGMRVYPYQRNDGRGGYTDPLPYMLGAITKLPPVTTPPNPTPTEPVPSVDNWQRAITWLLAEEGDFQDHEWDPGNWTGGKVGEGEKRGTKYGISAAAYPYLDIPSVTEKQASDLFYADYWLPSGADKLPWPACLVVLDTAVLHGVGRAAAWVEEVGVNAWLLAARRLASYTRSENWGNAGAGWINRVARLLQEVGKA